MFSPAHVAPSPPQNILVAQGWDVDKAYEVLKEKGLAAAAKKATRHAADGLVGVSFAAAPALGGPASTVPSSSTGGRGSVVIVELNSETDFVARNELFKGLLKEVLSAAHSLQGRSSTDGSAAQELDTEKVRLAGLLSCGRGPG